MCLIFANHLLTVFPWTDLDPLITAEWRTRTIQPAFYLTAAYFLLRHFLGKNPTSTIWPVFLIQFQNLGFKDLLRPRALSSSPHYPELSFSLVVLAAYFQEVGVAASAFRRFEHPSHAYPRVKIGVSHISIA